MTPSRLTRPRLGRPARRRALTLIVCSLVILLVQATIATVADAASLTGASWSTNNNTLGNSNSDYTWNFTTATSATVAKATMTVPRGTSGGGRYVNLDTSALNYVSTPDATANEITGDIDIRTRVSLASWASNVDAMFVAKRDIGTGGTAYSFGETSAGNLELYYINTAGGGVHATITKPSFTGGSIQWLRVTRVAATGAINFYTSVDGNTWSVIGTVPTAATGIHASTLEVDLGTDLNNGVAGTQHLNSANIYYADIRNAVGGLSSPSACSGVGVTVCFDPNQAPASISSTSPSWVSSTGESWTLHRSGSATQADLTAPLGVVSASGLAVGGTATLRMLDGLATYTLPTPTAYPSPTASSLHLAGFTNTTYAGAFSSTITTYTSAPAAIDTATTSAVTFGSAPATATWTMQDLRAGVTGNRYDFTLPATASGTAATVSATVPNGTSAPNRYLSLPGAAGNYASTPSSSGTATVTNLDIRSLVSAPSWTPGDFGNIVAKRNGTLSYALRLSPSGTMQLVYTTDGSTQIFGISPYVGGWAPNSQHWIRATLQGDNSASGNTVNFYTSTDGKSWTPFGSPTVNGGAITNLAINTAPVEIGSAISGTIQFFIGRIYYADVRNQIDAVNSTSNCTASINIVSCFDPNGASSTISTGSPTWKSPVPVASPEVWTINRSGSPAADVGADLSVANVGGVPVGGTASLRQMDDTITYTLPTPTLIPAGTAIQFGVLGLSNTMTTGSLTSTITEYDNSASPAVINSGTSAALTIGSPTISSASAPPPVIATATTATAIDLMPKSLGITGTSIYVTDSFANTVLKLNTGTGKAAGVAGNGLRGNINGTALASTFDGATGVAADALGNVYITDTNNNQIRKLDTSGNITKVAGGGASNSPTYSGIGTGAGLNFPHGGAVDSSNNFYFADTNDHIIRKLDTSGNLTTVAGSGTYGFSGDTTSALTATLSNPLDVTLDSSNNLYIADTTNNRIREVTVSNGNINTIAGGGGSFANNVGATSSSLFNPTSAAVDSSGNVYISDTGDQVIRKVSGGTITAYAGNGSVGSSSDGTTATSALLRSPTYIRVDGSGNVDFIDSLNWKVRTVISGALQTVAGDGTSSWTGDGGNISHARFNQPAQIVGDANGNMFVADTYNNAIRKVDKFGVVSTVAGTGPAFSTFGGDTGPATSAQLSNPQGVAVDPAGNIYIADTANTKIRKVNTSGVISTLATTGAVYQIAYNPFTGAVVATTNCQVISVDATSGALTVLVNTASTCTADSGDGGPASSAVSNQPRGIAVDSIGRVYFSEFSGHAVRRIDLNGNVSTVAGTGSTAINNINSYTRVLGSINRIAFDGQGNIYVGQSASVTRLTDGGIANTVAGTLGASGYTGDGGPATSATLRDVSGVGAVNGQLYISDDYEQVIRKVANAGGMAPNVNADSLAVAKNTPLTYPVESNDLAPYGEMDPNSVSITSAPSHGTATVKAIQGQITTATYTPTANYTGSDSFTYQACDSSLTTCATATDSVTVGSDAVTVVAGGLTEGAATGIGFNPARAAMFGNYLYISDNTFNAVRRLDTYSGQMVTIAGNATATFSGDGGPATAAGLNQPRGMAIAADGTIELADSVNNRVRQISPAGTITTVAGTGTSGNSGDGVSALSGQLGAPAAIAFGPTGAIYVTSGNKVRAFTVGGTISAFAGNGTSGTGGEGGVAASANFTLPFGLAFNSNGDLYIADSTNHIIRKVAAGTNIVTTVAGQPTTSGSTGDTGLATAAYLNTPKGIAIDASNNIYVADSGNNSIRKFTDGGTINTVAGGGGTYGDGGPAASAMVSTPGDVVLGNSGDYWITQGGDNHERYVSSANITSTVAGTGLTTSAYPDGASALTTQLVGSSGITGLAVDPAGNIYFGGSAPRVRRIDTVTSNVSTVAGNGTTGTASNNLSSNGQYAFDNSGNLVVADVGGKYLRSVAPGGVFNLISGTGASTHTGDPGPANLAGIQPNGAAYDSAGNAYVAENTYVRKITAAGAISTIAGSALSTSTGDGGLAINATFNGASAIAVGPDGNIYVLEKAGNRVRMIDRQGYISTVLGTGASSSSGDGGPAAAATINNPTGLTVDSFGNLYVAETSAARIRKVDAATGLVSTIVGTGSNGFVINTSGTSAQIINPRAIYASANGNLYFFDQSLNRVLMLKASVATSADALASATYSVSPGAVGHPNLREQFSVTPAASTTTSKISFVMPASAAGTPTVVSKFGITGTVTPSYTGGVLTLSFPSQTLAPGVAVGFGIEGWTSGGANAAFSSAVAMYDSSGSTVVGTARTNILNITSAGAPSSTDPGYASVWGHSLSYAQPQSSIAVAVSPLGAANSTSVVTGTMSGNLNTNAISLGVTAPTASVGTLSGATTDTSTSVTSGAFPLDRWGFNASTTSGTSVTGVNYSGSAASPATLVSAASSAAILTLSFRARVDYLLPAGLYTSTVSTKITPGS